METPRGMEWHDMQGTEAASAWREAMGDAMNTVPFQRWVRRPLLTRNIITRYEECLEGARAERNDGETGERRAAPRRAPGRTPPRGTTQGSEREAAEAGSGGGGGGGGGGDDDDDDDDDECAQAATSVEHRTPPPPPRAVVVVVVRWRNVSM